MAGEKERWLGEAERRALDDAMWQLAREGDVRAAKLVYERLATLLPPKPPEPPPLPPSWAEIEALYAALKPTTSTQKEQADGLLDDPADVGAGTSG